MICFEEHATTRESWLLGGRQFLGDLTEVHRLAEDSVWHGGPKPAMALASSRLGLEQIVRTCSCHSADLTAGL